LKVASNSLALGGGASGNIGISNIGGAVSGRLDTFALTGTSPRITTGLPQPGDNFAVIDLKSVGVRAVSIGGGQFGVQFAVTTFGGRSHPDYPSEFDVYVDTNNDGVFDYIIFNFENGGFGASGQTVVSVVNLQTGSVAGPFFFADADLNSANIILTAPLSALGNMPLGQKFNFQVFAFDNYFSGNLTDDIGPMTFTLSTPRFDNGGGFGSLAVPVGASGPIPVFKVAGGDAASPSQSGILLMYRDAKPGFESDAVTVTP